MIDRERAAKLILMLSSDHDGEVLNAARMLKKVGLHDIAELVRTGGQSPTIKVHVTEVDPFPFTGFGWGVGVDDFFRAAKKHSARQAQEARRKARADLLKVQIDDIVLVFKDQAPGISMASVNVKLIQRFIKKLGFDFVDGAAKSACGRGGAQFAFREFEKICLAEIRVRQEGA